MLVAVVQLADRPTRDDHDPPEDDDAEPDADRAGDRANVLAVRLEPHRLLVDRQAGVCR